MNTNSLPHSYLITGSQSAVDTECNNNNPFSNHEHSTNKPPNVKSTFLSCRTAAIDWIT